MTGFGCFRREKDKSFRHFNASGGKRLSLEMLFDLKREDFKADKETKSARG